MDIVRELTYSNGGGIKNMIALDKSAFDQSIDQATEKITCMIYFFPFLFIQVLAMAKYSLVLT